MKGYPMIVEPKRIILKLENIVENNINLDKLNRLYNKTKEYSLEYININVYIISLITMALISLEIFFKLSIFRYYNYVCPNTLFSIIEYIIVLIVYKKIYISENIIAEDTYEKPINNIINDKIITILIFLKSIQFALDSYFYIFQDNILQIILNHSDFYQSFYNIYLYYKQKNHDNAPYKDVLKVFLFIGYIFSSVENYKLLSAYLVFVSLIIRYLKAKYYKKLEFYNKNNCNLQKEKIRKFCNNIKILILFAFFMINMEYKYILENLNYIIFIKSIISLNLNLIFRFIKNEKKSYFIFLRNLLIFGITTFFCNGKSIFQYFFIVGLIILNVEKIKNCKKFIYCY